MDRRSCFFPSRDNPLLTRYDRWRGIGKLLKLSAPARLRLEWIIFYHTKAERNVALTARHFGVSRKAIHAWLNRFDETNLRSLESGSRRPHRVRRPTFTALQEERVRELRSRYSTAGRDKLQVLYQEDYGEPIGYWHMRRIVHDRGLYAERAVRTKRQAAQRTVIKHKRITELIKQPIQGFLVEADGIVIYFANQKRYVFTAIDYWSRIGFAYMYTSKGSRNAADFLRRLVLLYGGRIDNLHIDNGSEFKKDFLKAADELKITLYHARPYRAQDKPLVERFNGILQQEWIDLGHFTLDVEQFNRSLMDYLIYYNFKRPHHSLGLRRPMEVATMKMVDVLPMWSPMTGG